ncbi:MAG: YSC84-related protein [Porticoccaceae bacterium]|nr:YSC84-related protein [Porticoccaceae bacterium]
MNVLLSLLLSVFLGLGTVSANAATKDEIDAYAGEALAEFYKQSPAGKDLAQRAKGILIFPRVVKAGFGVGGEYGEGKLIVGGQTAGYYSTAAASIGLQIGAQRKSQLILFMTDSALESFRNTDGWEVGVDGSVAVATLGAGGAIDSNTLQKPIIGFIFSNKGLMYNLTFEGSKMTKIDP